MTFINYAAREINCKIVYYGPGLCGKTTNLQYIYDRTNPSAKGKLISLATETDRTLFFDFLPLDLGTVKGFKTRFHLYTVPGQVFYDASRKLILKGVDGVVFVADSQEARLEANIESIRNLGKNEAAVGSVGAHGPQAPVLRRGGGLPGVAFPERIRSEPGLGAQVTAEKRVRLGPVASGGPRETPHRRQRIVGHVWLTRTPA